MKGSKNITIEKKTMVQIFKLTHKIVRILVFSQTKNIQNISKKFYTCRMEMLVY